MPANQPSASLWTAQGANETAPLGLDPAGTLTGTVLNADGGQRVANSSSSASQAEKS